MADTQLQHTEAKADLLTERIPDFYRGRCVLVTGGSGFVGRVLLEKLLRCCPDLHTVFLLLRTRKGVLPQDRLKALTDVPLFDRLRAERPGALAKVQVVAGDSAQPGLGMSPADAQQLRERVSVVFHVAASVRFDDPLATALHTNTRSTRDLLQLATQMPLLKAFVHVSTAFCNMGQDAYEEKLYPPPADCQTLLKAAETLDPFHLQVLTKKILGNYCNSYVFTKCLAEHLVAEYQNRLPVGILRPSVVLNTWEDPVPGWLDNFNGPVGLMVGAAKGVYQFFYNDPNTYIDYVPCDVIVKGMIISSCEIARKGVGDLPLYHGALCEKRRYTHQEFNDIMLGMNKELPFKESLYFPFTSFTANFLLFYVQIVFFKLLPFALMDACLFIAGKKPMLVRLLRRILLANMNVSYFMTRNWNFLNQRFQSLSQKLVEADQIDFSYNLHNIDTYDIFFKGVRGARRFMFHELDSDLPLARYRYKRNRIIHLMLKTLFHFFVAWVVLSTLPSVLPRML